jgi:hypothetical protein
MIVYFSGLPYAEKYDNLYHSYYFKRISYFHTDKEFVIYESSFSDILGIIIFNFAITNHSINTSALFIPL